MNRHLVRRITLRLCCFGLIVWLIAVQAMSADDDSVHIDLDSLISISLGGPNALSAIDSLTSVCATGNIRLNALEGKFTTIMVAPDKYYNEITFPDFSLVQGYNGILTWARNYNNRYVPLTGYEREELLKDIYFESFAFLTHGKVNNTVFYHDDVTLDTIRYHEIGFLPTGTSDTVLVYFAVEGGQRKLVTSKLDNAVTMTYIDQYRTVDSINFPSAIRILAPASGLNVAMEITDITVNRSYPDSLFTPDFTSQIDYRFPAESSSITIPIIYQNGQIAIHAKVNGAKKVHFILDTGASSNIFGARLSADIGLPVVGVLPAKGVSGFSSVNLVRVDSLEIGGITLLEQMGGSLDLGSMIATDDTAEYLGILGYDFFSHFPIMVDYHAQTMTIYNPASFTAPAGGISLPFDLTMFVPTVQAEVNGIQGKFMIDLGNSFGVIVHPHFAKTNQLDQLVSDDSAKGQTIGGVGGNLNGQMATVDSFRVGAITLANYDVIMTEGSQGVTGSEEIAGNIGNQFLQSYAVLIDYHLNRFILYPVDTQ